VLSEGGKLGLSSKKLTSINNFAKRTNEILLRTERAKLNDEEKVLYDFNASKVGNIRATSQLRMGKSTLPQIESERKDSSRFDASRFGK
jgi:hypothetical protein